MDLGIKISARRAWEYAASTAIAAGVIFLWIEILSIPVADAPNDRTCDCQSP